MVAQKALASISSKETNMTSTPIFQTQVLNFLTTIPRGRVVTYGQIAQAIGHPGAARAVGNALHHNPDGNEYPCYKVVDSKGRLSGRFAFGGVAVQQERLMADGIEVVDNRVNLAKYQFRPVV